MVSENVFMTQLTGIGTPGPQLSPMVDVLQRAKDDVSELIDPSMGRQQYVVSCWPATVRIVL